MRDTRAKDEHRTDAPNSYPDHRAASTRRHRRPELSQHHPAPVPEVSTGSRECDLSGPVHWRAHSLVVYPTMQRSNKINASSLVRMTVRAASDPSPSCLTTSCLPAWRAVTLARPTAVGRSTISAEGGFPRPTFSRSGCGMLDYWLAGVDPARPGSTSFRGVDCVPARLKSALAVTDDVASAVGPPWLSGPGGHGISAGRASKPRAIPTGTDRAITVILGGLSEHGKRRRGEPGAGFSNWTVSHRRVTVRASS